MKRKVIAVLMASVMALSMAACGSGKNDSGSSSDTGSGNDAAKSDAAGDDADASDASLTVWTWDPNFNIYAMQVAEKIYAETHEGFKLNIVERQSTDIETDITTAVGAGDLSTLPDIFLMQDNSFQKFATNFPEVFYDLTDSGIDFSQFAEAKTAYSVLEGKNYGVPFDNGAVINCIRTDMIEEAGYTLDDFTDITWADYMEKAKKVTEATGQPMLTAQAGSPDVIMMMLQSCGESLFNEDGTGNIVGNDALKKCMEVYAQMVADGTLVEVTDWNSYISSLNSNTVASTFNGCWIMASITTADDQSGKWAITNMPKMEGIDGATNYSNNGGSSWAVCSASKDPELAIDFLNATFAGSTALYDDIISKGALATWAPAGESEAYAQPVEFFADDAVYAKIVDFATKTPSNLTGPYYYDARDAVGVALSNVIQSGADLDSELQAAQDTLDFNMGG